MQRSALPLTVDQHSLPRDGPPIAADVCRGVSRLLWLHGFSPLSEVTLADGRRVDLMGVSRTGKIAIVEVKVSAADLLGDCKWHYYRAFCDMFYWAVPEHLADLVHKPQFDPEGAGLIVADRHEALLVRDPQEHLLSAARRKAVTLAFARTGAERALRVADPGFDGFAAF